MPVPIRQAAALPIRDGLVCMVTSRNGRRWVIPKGQIDPGHTSAEAALIEAWEEAGLTGVLDGEPVGSYHYEKYGVDHHVMVYVMRVTQQSDDYPERDQRQREWVNEEVTLSRIHEPGLQAIVREVFRIDRSLEELAFDS